MAQDKVNKLASLLVNPASGRPEPADDAEDEAKLADDINKVMTLVGRLAGDDFFDMQLLIESCADEIRDAIRQSVEGDDE